MVKKTGDAPKWTATWSLLSQLTRREIGKRYKGSFLGILWSLLTPLFLLLVYTFIFGAVFESKWPRPEGTEGEQSLAEFAIILFAGLTTFNLFADVVTRSPTLIQENKNFVTRVRFPLEILPLIQLGAGLFQYFVSMTVLIVAVWITLGYVPYTLVALPLVLLPLCILIAGLAWFFAALGTFIRDISQFLSTVVSAMMFLSPIFFARSVLPDGLAQLTLYNPLTIPVEETRKVLIYGQWPDPLMMSFYVIVALLIACTGRYAFERLRPGFADVI